MFALRAFFKLFQGVISSLKTKRLTTPKCVYTLYNFTCHLFSLFKTFEILNNNLFAFFDCCISTAKYISTSVGFSGKRLLLF